MIIKNAIVCDANGERQVDVAIENGLISQIGSSLEGSEIVDANGAYLLPGIIDFNVALKDAQLNTSRLESLSSSAIKGGVCSLVLNPESEPAVNNEIVLEFVLERQHPGAKIKSAVCATKDEKTLSNIAILLKKGAAAPLVDSSIDNNLIRRVFEYMKMYDGTVFCSVKDKALNGNGVMFEGAVSSELGLPGISVLGEIIHVSKIIEMSRYFGVQVLFKGLFTRRSLEMIRQAREEGVKVFSEISIHHLALDDRACAGFNAYAKIFPPLSNEKGKLALRDALINGEIDLLTSLHSPQSKVNKEVAFYDAAYGTECIEDILSLYYTKLVETGMITLAQLSQMVSKTPAEMIKRNAGMIEEGRVADLILFDARKEYVVENEQSLYQGETLKGRVTQVIIDGERRL